MLSHTPRSPLPHPLLDVFHTVLAILEKHIAAEDWNPFELITSPTRWTVPCAFEDSGFPIRPDATVTRGPHASKAGLPFATVNLSPIRPRAHGTHLQGLST